MLRILDANLNRIGEGLRVLEDISRFILNEPDLTRRLKALRHDLLPTDIGLREKLLAARQAAEDVGASLGVAGESDRLDVPALVSANSLRIQQSLRVIEETTKVPGQDFGFDWKKMKDARFGVYELEQGILLKLARRDKTDRIAGLYLVLDRESLGDRDDLEIARLAIQGGARVIQLRDKTRPRRPRSKLLTLAVNLREMCAASGALFIVNDDLDIALASDADGLHVGQEDLPVSTARGLLPVGKIVGCSTATTEEAVRAQGEGADYIGVGSIYQSSSKPGTRHAGLETLRQVRARVSLPIVAIGGINEENINDVIEAGANAAAVISAVLGATDIEESCRRLNAAIGGN